MSEKLTERMARYEGQAGTEMRGRIRILPVDTPEFTDWLNEVAALEAKLRAMELKQKASDLLDDPPSPYAPGSEWQRWQSETNAAIVAAKTAQEEQGK